MVRIGSRRTTVEEEEAMRYDQTGHSLKKTLVPKTFWAGPPTCGVYGLRDPLTGAVRYIGSSQHVEKRYASHVNSRSKVGQGCLAKARWTMDLRSTHALRPELVVLVTCEPADLLALEKRFIEAYDLVGEADFNWQHTSRVTPRARQAQRLRARKK